MHCCNLRSGRKALSACLLAAAWLPRAYAAPYPQATATSDPAAPTLTISAFILPSYGNDTATQFTNWQHGSTGGGNTTVWATGLVTQTVPAVLSTTTIPDLDTFTLNVPGTTITANRTVVDVYGPSTIAEYANYGEGVEGM